MGLIKDRPRVSPHSYIEKLEYWAMAWGTVVMSITGVMLWANNLTLRFLPKVVLDVATSVHFYEALLAALAILVWHFYSVIFDPDVYPLETAFLTGVSVKEEEAESWEHSPEIVAGEDQEQPQDLESYEHTRVLLPELAGSSHLPEHEFDQQTRRGGGDHRNRVVAVSAADQPARRSPAPLHRNSRVPHPARSFFPGALFDSARNLASHARRAQSRACRGRLSVRLRCARPSCGNWWYSSASSPSSIS